MNTEHTPGPWRISEHDDGTIVGPRAGQSSTIVAAMPVWFIGRKPGEHATQDHQRANARLIAAAPDLLAACRHAVQALLNDPFSTSMQKEALAECKRALTKATGNEIPTPAISGNLNQPL